MDNQPVEENTPIVEAQPTAKPRSQYWKFVGRFVAIVLGTLVVSIGIAAYLQYREASIRSQKLLSTPHE